MIGQYSLIETELEDQTPGSSHASHLGDGTLCGVSIDDLGCVRWSELSYADGIVSCELCMAELRKLDLVGRYAGPLRFVDDLTVVDGILLDDFGWAVFDSAIEHFFAYGHHEPGVVLDLARKLSKNKLIGWEEQRIPIYAHWELFEPGGSEPPFCYRVWCRSETTSDPQILRIDRYDATVIRYEGWPLLRKVGGKAEYDCKWIKAWFDGTTKLGRAATPADMTSDDTPGFTVHGKPAGETVTQCLEWPTPDFDLAIESMNKWQGAGATELSILNHGLELPKEMLTPKLIAQIQRDLSAYGADMTLLDLLENGID